MSSRGRSLTSNIARLVWGTISGLLLLALLATVFLGRGRIDEAEAEAQARAADWGNTVLFAALTPDQVTAPILGPDYRELLITVQAGILSDDRAVRVRIWNADSLLVFSTDQRDKIDGSIAADNPQIETALGGDTVSVPTQATVAPKSGLAGTDEKLFQTFVPLRIENQLGVSGVVQIDQRYAAIEDEAADVWQTARLALVIALTVSVAALLFTLRRRPGTSIRGVEAGAPAPTRQDRRALERAARAEDELRAARAQAEQAEAARAEAESTVNETVTRLRELEERAAQAEERAATAELALQEAARTMTGGEAPRRGVPGVGAVAVAPPDGELEAKLQDAARERDLVGEVGRLRAALAEREAELALTREPDARIAELEARLAAATAGTEEPSAAAEDGASAVEAKLAEMETLLAGMEARSTRAERELAEAKERAATAEAKLAQLEMTQATAAAEVERVRAEAAATPKAAAAGGGDVEELRVRIAELEDTRRNDIAELQRAQEALANTQYEAAQARRQVKELEDRLAESKARPTEPVAEHTQQPEVTEPSFSSRLGHLAREHETPPASGAEEPEPEPEVDEASLSLRERLARAAAARHRAPGAPGSDR